MREIARRELADRRLGIVGWMVGYVAMVLITTASFPSVRDTWEIQAFMDELPAALKGLLGSQELDFTSGAGYVNGRLVAFTFPIMLLVYVLGFGSRAIAGEHEDGRLDLVVSYPVSRRDLALGKVGVMLGITSLFIVGSLFAVWLTGLPVELGVGPAEMWPAALMMLAFAAFFGGLALLVGCWRLERTTAIAVPAGLALAGWLINSVSAVASWLEPVRALSPLWWYTRANPLRDGLDVQAFGLLAGGAVLFLGAALVVFDRRDLA
jgi:ABC-2 type transport system permease protein